MKDAKLFYALIFSIPFWSLVFVALFLLFGCASTYRIPADQYLYVGGLPAAVENIRQSNGHDSCYVDKIKSNGVAVIKCVKGREK